MFMKRNWFGSLLVWLGTVLGAVCPACVHAQGTLTFNWPWIDNGVAWPGIWPESGLVLKVIPQPPLTRDAMGHVGAWTPGYPTNGTPKLIFVRYESETDYVMIARTNDLPFGLVCVDLADPVAPSQEPIDITFNGFKSGGVMVSQTFTVGGGGSSSFQTFYFRSEFAHGLIRVEIPSARWAMDNLVWVPEPRVGVIWILGILVGLRLFTPGNGGRSR